MARTLVLAMVVVTMLGRSAAADEDAEHQQWRKAFYGSLALTIGTAAFWGVSYASMRSEAGDIVATKPGADQITQDDCNDRAGISGDEGDHFDSACTWRSRSRTASMFTLGFGLVTLATAYFAFVDKDEPAHTQNLAVTPTISRDGAGAQLLLRW